MLKTTNIEKLLIVSTRLFKGVAFFELWRGFVKNGDAASSTQLRPALAQVSLSRLPSFRFIHLHFVNFEQK